MAHQTARDPFNTASLTEKETTALESLRSFAESENNTDETGTWCNVYLDNAKPAGWNHPTWDGVLGSLTKKGYYREDDGYAWGLVLKS